MKTKDEARPLVRSVLCVPFSVLTLIIGWQEEQHPIKILFDLSPEVIFLNSCRRSTQGEPAVPGSLGKMVMVVVLVAA